MLKKITAAFLIAINIGAMAAQASTMQLGDSTRTTRATEEFIYNPHSGVYEYGDAIHPEVQVQWFL